jgi:hypothetical protein
LSTSFVENFNHILLKFKLASIKDALKKRLKYRTPFHKKSNSYELDFFICAVRHNIICVAHATSFQSKKLLRNFARTSLPPEAQMNDVEALPQMKLPSANEVGLRPMMLRLHRK